MSRIDRDVVDQEQAGGVEEETEGVAFDSSRLLPPLACLLAMLAGTAWLGWVLDRRELSAGKLDLIPMAPSTATCFLLLAASLLLLSQHRFRNLNLTLLGTVALFAGVRLVEFTFAWDLGLEDLLWDVDLLGPSGYPLGKMALPTALAFLASLAATGPLLTSAQWSFRSAVWSGVSGSLGLSFLLGYIYGAPLLYGGETIPMALTTAFGFVFFASALLAENSVRLTQLQESRSRERTRLHHALSLAVEDLENLVAKNQDGVLVRSTEGQDLYLNRAAREMTEAFEVEVLEGAQPNGPLEVETSDGRHLEVHTRPIDWRGSPSLLHSIRDVTGLKEAARKLNETENLFRHSQKMEAVGRLAGGVAHDFNNLLTAILGYTSLLKGSESRPQQHEELDEIERAARRATDLTGRLLAISRSRPHRVEAFELNRTVTETEKLLMRLLPPNVKLECRTPDDDSWVEADPSSMEQILLNLVVNARDALPEGGRIHVEVAHQQLEEPYADSLFRLEPGNYILLKVSDNGCGIPKEALPRIFDPYFTTKESGKGTGLGLSTVYGIVEQAGGATQVYSVLGTGTTFKVFLPQVNPPIRCSTPPDQSSKIMTEVPTRPVLVVEDDATLQKLTSRILERRGYRSEVVGSAEAALEAMVGADGSYLAVVSDLMLPKMNGSELFQTLRAQGSELPFVLTSGYSQYGVIDSHPDLLFLEKPFTPNQLIETLERALVRGFSVA